MARAKMWKDGKEFYGKGIAVLTQKDQDKVVNKVDDIKDQGTKEDAELLREVEEACYINRALCNLELSKSNLTLAARVS